MAIYYNQDDKVYYGTNAERVAADVTKFPPTSKFYEFDTGDVYITNADSSAWYLV